MQDPLISYRTGREEQQQEATVADYLALLEQNAECISMGIFGVHLAPAVTLGKKDFFFPMLGVPGHYDQDKEIRIASTIFNTTSTLKELARIKADRLFRIIATGDNHCLLISRHLLPMEYCRAFSMFVRMELPHILEKQFISRPHETVTLFECIPDIGQPGCAAHSEPVADIWSNPSPEEFIRWTLGLPNADTIIQFMKWLLEIKPIHDLEELGEYGNRIIHYRQKLLDQHIFPFTPPKLSPRPLSTRELHDALKDRGIKSKIERRGDMGFISFKKLPCPSCGRSDVNASAYPPFFTLQCFNSRCDASAKKGGLPLLKWAGIVNEYERRESATSQMVYVRPPAKFQTIAEARALIRQGMASNRDVLFLVTPGVGKTQEALQYLVTQAGKVILYSCCNRKLKDEAFQKCLSFASTIRNAIPGYQMHSIKPRTDLCLEQDKLQRVTRMGYSPAMILCKTCRQKAQCQYVRQFDKSFGPGIYFVTHQMLEYLEPKISNPDLIVLDENLLKGFIADTSASEQELRTLLTVLEGNEGSFVEEMIQIGSCLANQAAKNPSVIYSMIVNGRRISNFDMAQDTLLDVYARRKGLTDQQVESLLDAIKASLADLDSRQLYRKNVSRNAIDWISGLFDSTANHFSYMEAYRNSFNQWACSFRTKKILPLKYSSATVKILDATGHLKLAEVLTGRKDSIELVRADVCWPSQSIHIKQKLNRYNISSLKPAELKSLVSKALAQMEEASKILVLTHAKVNNGQALGEKVLDLCRQAAPQKEFDLHNYFGPRGINDYKDHEAIFLLGRSVPNINSAFHESVILFPDAADQQIRDAWIELSTNWELIQCIHRVRPIYKTNTKLVFADDPWPVCLPDPNEIIDMSRDGDIVEKVVERLRPYMAEMGFMNRDLALLAGVVQHRHEKIFENIHDDFLIFDRLRSVSGVRFARLAPHLRYNSIMSACYDRSVPYLLYIENMASQHFNKSVPIRKLASLRNAMTLSKKDLVRISSIQHLEIIKTLHGHAIHFKDFEIRSGYGNGQVIRGIGLPEQVSAFYKALNGFDGFRKTRLSSLKFDRYGKKAPAYSIPSGYIVATSSQYCDDIIRVAYLKRNLEIGIGDFQNEAGRIVRQIQAELDRKLSSEGIVMVTDRGKLMASLLGARAKNLKIRDIVAQERILTCGIKNFRNASVQDLFDRYGLDAGSFNDLGNMFEVWKKQDDAIREENLEKVIDLEEKMLRVMADIEKQGIFVDGKSLNGIVESMPPSPYEKQADAILGRVGEDGRFHDGIDFMGATSARLVSKLDNVPRKGPLRSFFKAREGYRFIVADYRQQEPRIMAGLSEDEALLDIFNTGKDLYASEAAAMTELLGMEVGRSVAKNIVNAINNMGSAHTVKRILSESGFVVELEEAKRYFNSYRNKFGKLFYWQSFVVHQAYSMDFVATELGRRRYLGSSTGGSGAFNYAVQGTAADGFKMALVSIWEALAGMDAYIVYTMRDEVIVEAQESAVEQVKGIVQDCMQQAFAGIVSGVEFPVEISVRESWGEAWPEEDPGKTGGAVEGQVPWREPENSQM